MEKSILNNSGVSETIGFIIIFGIAISGIALVTLYGYPALLQEQANANIRNMERNMISLQSDINSLTYKNDPYKETSLQVSGGTLSIEPNSDSVPNFTVSVGGNTYGPYVPGAVNFNSQDGMSTISLENGAVHIRYWNSPNGSAMLAEPRWFYDEPTETYVVSFINLTSANYLAQTGIGRVEMRLDSSNTSDRIPINNNAYIRYNADISNNYKVAWYDYFKNPSLKMQSCTETGLSTQCQLDQNAQYLIIKTYNITVLSL